MLRLRTIVPLCVLAGAAALPGAARADALTEIDACITRLDPDVDVGFERIAARCPELGRHLRASDLAVSLPAGWDDAQGNLSAKSLAALHMLVVRERALAAPTRVPDVARFRPILGAVAARNEAPHGWWRRFQNWLRDVLARSQAESGAGAFSRLFGRVSLPQVVLRVVAYATIVLVVLFAACIVANEWRLAARRKCPRRAQPGTSGAEDQRARALSWHDVEGAEPRERPRMLLGLIAARLTAARRLPATAALTVREVARAAQLPDADDKERLIAVALAAERLRFSEDVTAPENLTAVMQRGRELLERLSTAREVGA